MGSFCTCGKIHFVPDENDLAKCGTEEGYAFSVPTVCLESEENSAPMTEYEIRKYTAAVISSLQ